MMLLRINNRFVNMDSVSDIFVESEDLVWINFGRDAEADYHAVLLKDEEASAFLNWLNANATNLTPSTPDEEEWEEYKRKGGDMALPEWEQTRRSLQDINRNLDSMNAESPGWERQMSRASELEGRLLY